MITNRYVMRPAPFEKLTVPPSVTKCLTRIIEFTPAFDQRSPDPHHNYGVNGVEARWVLKGAKGAVQFLLSTGWQLADVAADFERTLADESIGIKGLRDVMFGPLPIDLGYHSRRPRFEGQTPIGSAPCPYIDGAPCYFDGSTLQGARLFTILTERGGEGVWQALGQYYFSVFGW